MNYLKLSVYMILLKIYKKRGNIKFLEGSKFGIQGGKSMQLIEGRFVKDDQNNEYLIEKFIGNGAFGNVFKIIRLSDNTEWALKTIV